MKKFRFNKKTNNLFEAVLALKTKREAEMFFRDLCTVKEIMDFADRWEIVRLLKNGESYRVIAEKLSISTTTVSRVALWLNNGEGGYEKIYKRLNNTHHHKTSFEKSL